jgi:hypothetical protein
VTEEKAPRLPEPFVALSLIAEAGMREAHKAYLEHLLKELGSDGVASYLAEQLRLQPPNPEYVETLANILDGKDKYFQIIIKPRHGAQSQITHFKKILINNALKRERARGQKHGMRKRVANYFGIKTNSLKKTLQQRKRRK